MPSLKTSLRNSLLPAFFALLAISCGGLETDLVVATPTTSPDSAPASYTLTVSAGAGGTITPVGSAVYTSGTVVVLNATPGNGNVVASWTGTNNEPSTAVQNQVTMSTDKTVSVAFTAASVNTYTLGHTAGTHGTLTVSPDQAHYNDGTVVTLTATPDIGYQVQQWLGTDNNGSTSNTNQITMSGQNQNVSVSFVATATNYILTYYTPDNWGSLSFSPAGTVSANTVSYPAGTDVTVTATALSGALWRYGCMYLGNTLIDTVMSAPHTLVNSQSVHVTMNASATLNAFFPYKTVFDGLCPETGFSIHP